MRKHLYRIDREKTDNTHYVFICEYCGSEHGIIKYAFQMMGTNPTWGGNIAYWSRWKRYQEWSDDTCVDRVQMVMTVDSVLMVWVRPSGYQRLIPSEEMRNSRFSGRRA